MPNTKVTYYTDDNALVEIPQTLWQDFVAEFGIDETCWIFTSKLLPTKPTTKIYHFHIIDSLNQINESYTVELD